MSGAYALGYDPLRADIFSSAQQLSKSPLPCCPHRQTLAGEPCPASDLWFIGVLVYLLLGGSPPFVGDDEEATKEAILKAEVRLPSAECVSSRQDRAMFLAMVSGSSRSATHLRSILCLASPM